MSLGKFGSDKRSEATSITSILEEMTPEQRASYTPEQLETLWSQRKRVRISPPEAMRFTCADIVAVIDLESRFVR